jgi:hypothetical protein
MACRGYAIARRHWFRPMRRGRFLPLARIPWPTPSAGTSTRTGSSSGSDYALEERSSSERARKPCRARRSLPLPHRRTRRRGRWQSIAGNADPGDPELLTDGSINPVARKDDADSFRIAAAPDGSEQVTGIGEVRRGGHGSPQHFQGNSQLVEKRAVQLKFRRDPFAAGRANIRIAPAVGARLGTAPASVRMSRR